MSSYNVQIVKSQIWQQHNPSKYGSSSRLFIQNFCRVPSSRKRGVVGHQMTSGEEEKCSRKDEKITGLLKKFFPSAAPGKREVDQVMHSRSKLSLERYCQHHRFNRNFVLGFGSWTNNAKLLPFKLSKISSHRPIISLGLSNLIIEMIISIVTWIISIIVPSLSLSLWVFSEQTRKWSGSSRPTDLWKRKDYSPQIHIIRLSSSFSITIPTGKTPRKRNHEKCYKSPE